jgi:hypothetical protein
MRRTAEGGLTFAATRTATTRVVTLAATLATSIATTLALTVLVAVPVFAQTAVAGTTAGRAAGPSTAPATGELFGLVTDASGRPEANAVVEVRAGGLGTAGQRLRTSEAGIFSLLNLPTGVYYVEVGKGTRVATRQRVTVHASERALVLVSLPQMLESVHLGPPPAGTMDHAFDWALRQSTEWKPVLRWDDVASSNADVPMQGYVALTAGAGSSAFDAPDLATAFRVDSSLAGALVSFTGDVGTNGQGGGSDTRVAAAFRPRDPTSSSRLTLAARQLSIPGVPNGPALRVLSINYANGLALGDRLRLQYGAMMNAVTFTDTAATFDPYLRVQYRVGAQGELEYRAVSAVPPVHFNRDYAEMPDPTRQVTLDHNHARLERARHQELMYSESLSPNSTVTTAVFDEHFSRAAVNGTFSNDGNPAPLAAASSGDLLPDLLNNMFVADGGNYGGWGYRVVWDQHLGNAWRADVGFSDGAVLVPAAGRFSGEVAGALVAGRARAVTFRLTGTTPLTHTGLVCSYRAVNRPIATGLDLYDDGAGQSQAYANISLRQPLPSLLGAGAGHIAALVEINNLLAQGYIPMVVSDGRTLYLVQSARSLRGGFTISF